MGLTDSHPGSTRILLLRHAETAAPALFHGAESDVGLSSRGYEQAARVAQLLAEFPLVAIYSSELQRARETARVIAQAIKVPRFEVKALHERKMGPLSGVARSDYAHVYAQTKARWEAGEVDQTHEGGESFAMIRERIVPAFLEITEKYPGKTVAVVAHGIVIRVLLTTLLPGNGPADFGSYAINHVAINNLQYDGQRWRAKALDWMGAAEPSDHGPAW